MKYKEEDDHPKEEKIEEWIKGSNKWILKSKVELFSDSSSAFLIESKYTNDNETNIELQIRMHDTQQKHI